MLANIQIIIYNVEQSVEVNVFVSQLIHLIT